MPVSLHIGISNSLSDSVIVSPSLCCDRYQPIPVGKEGKRLHQELLMTPGQQGSPTQHPVSVSWTKLMVVIKHRNG